MYAFTHTLTHYITHTHSLYNTLTLTHSQGNFYAELLKALILEGQVELARRLLEMKRSSQVRLRASEDNEKMHAIEQLVDRAIKSGRIAPKQ